MTIVYAWPCVGAIAREWTVEDRVNVSYSALTEKEYISQAGRRRRLAELRISSLSAGHQGAGYMEAMKRLLKDRVNAVRLYSYPINYRDVVGLAPPISAPLEWLSGASQIQWMSGSSVITWITGAYYTPTPYPLTLLPSQDGMGRARVTGLPASRHIARVGAFATVFNAAGDAFETRMLLRAVVASGGGIANIWTDEPFTAAGSVEFNTRDTGVFKALDMPRSIKPRFGDWEYAWSFREVFADEQPDGFREVNPWG